MDPQQAALSQSSQDPQLADIYSSYSQTQSLEYNENAYAQTTSPTTMTNYDQLADHRNSSLLASGFDQPCVEVALDDDGADEDGDGGVSFAASVEDGLFPDTQINAATIVNAGARAMKPGASIAQSAVNASSGINLVAMVSAGAGMANSALNAI